MGNILGGRHYKKFSKGYLDREHLTYDLMKSKKLSQSIKKVNHILFITIKILI